MAKCIIENNYSLDNYYILILNKIIYAFGIYIYIWVSQLQNLLPDLNVIFQTVYFVASVASICVPRDILLTKLEYYGFRGVVLSLMKSYITDWL